MSYSELNYENSIDFYKNLDKNQLLAMTVEKFNTLSVFEKSNPKIFNVVKVFIPYAISADGVFSDEEKEFLEKAVEIAGKDSGLSEYLDGTMYKVDLGKMDKALETYGKLSTYEKTVIFQLVMTVISIDGVITKEEEVWARSLSRYF